MKKFILTLFLFLLPFIIIFTTYFLLDPFKVIRKYDAYINPKSNGWVGLNKDHISTSNFENKYLEQQYNSFIFGNSRSIFYEIDDWSKHLAPPANCYHFDASSETLFGINKKLKFIDSKNVKIKNVLLIMDYLTLMQDKPRPGHLFVIPPQLVGNENFISFHAEFLKSFISFRFLFTYIDFKLSGKVKQYMKADRIIDDRPMEYNPLTNEMRYEFFENLIAEGKYYTPKRMEEFVQRDTIQLFSPVAITVIQKPLLKEIAEIFQKHNTNYKIVINPLYQQVKLNKLDVDYLNKLFGSENIFDFSGINNITNDYNNYYESSHYRPHVSREIMNRIYQEGSNDLLK